MKSAQTKNKHNVSMREKGYRLNLETNNTTARFDFNLTV